VSSSDCFALLDEPRQPWLEPEQLRIKFQRLSAAYHPDRVHGADAQTRAEATHRYAALNAAYQCLREPKERLRHLLELESAHAPTGVDAVPPELMAWFGNVGALNRTLSQLLAAKARVTAPLLRAQWFQEAMPHLNAAQTLLRSLLAQTNQLHSRLQEMNPLWDNAPPVGDTQRPAQLPLPELEQIYRTLSYLNRWTSQLQEQVVQLTL